MIINVEGKMEKTVFTVMIIMTLLLSLTACGAEPSSDNETPVIEMRAAEDTMAQEENDSKTTPSPTDEPDAEASVSDEPAEETGRQDGERFETVITLEGMEETVRYEHIVNADAGFEMDYDYESFVRQSEADRELFISVWDDPADPENYLEVRYDTGSDESVADAISADLSQEYDLIRETRKLERAGSCIYIEASELKGTGMMADELQAVYIIPASVGCRVATAHFSIEAAEGFGRRFNEMLHTLSVIENDNLAGSKP